MNQRPLLAGGLALGAMVPVGSWLLAGLLGSAIAAPGNNTVYSCTFGTNGWSREDWTLVDRPDLKRGGDWKQTATYIENDNPECTSMVYRKRLHGDVNVSCTLAFLDRMAPSLILAGRLHQAPGERPVYADHFEIVVWDQGINVWHHRVQDGKSVWTKTAFCTLPLAKGEPHRLQVRKKGQELTMTVGTTTFGYVDPSLPEDYQVGITGEEGLNRFYDLTIEQPVPPAGH